MAGVEITNNTGAFRAALKKAMEDALDMVGAEWSDEAKRECEADGYWPDELGDSISYKVDKDNRTVNVGSNMEIAAYAELGTGKHYSPPPEYIENHVKKGTVIPAGLDHWIYYDPLDNKFKMGAPQEPHPFLRPAYEKNRSRWNGIIENELREAKG